MPVNGLLPPQRVPVRAKPDQEIEPLAVSLAVAAKLVGVSEPFFRRFVDAGEIPYVQLGERRVFRIASIDRWLLQREVSAMPEAPP